MDLVGDAFCIKVSPRDTVYEKAVNVDEDAIYEAIKDLECGDELRLQIFKLAPREPTNPNRPTRKPRGYAIRLTREEGKRKLRVGAIPTHTHQRPLPQVSTGPST